jgi:hypothetical protein
VYTSSTIFIGLGGLKALPSFNFWREGSGCNFLLGHTLTSNLIECPKCGSVVDLLLGDSKALFGSPEDFPSKPFPIPPAVLSYWGGSAPADDFYGKFLPDNVSLLSH